MKILKSVQKVPGGIMVIPMVIGAVIHTFCPQILEIGSFTTALFSSQSVAVLIGLTLFFIGTQMKVREAPEALKRGTVLLLAKFLAGAALAVFIAKVFGLAGVLGISSLAILSSFTNSNGGIYMALVGSYGDPQDMAAQSVLNLNDGPFLTLLTLGAAGLGGSINFFDILKAGPTGAILAVLLMLVSGLPAFLADRHINKRPGYAGAATATAAGNSIATPAAVALIDPSYAPYVASATAQIAGAVIITAVLVPIITSYVAKKYGCPRFDQEEIGNA